MLDKNEISILLHLTNAGLGYARETLRLSDEERLSQNDFDSLTLGTALRLTALSRLYADLADIFGTACFSERTLKIGTLDFGRAFLLVHSCNQEELGLSSFEEHNAAKARCPGFLRHEGALSMLIKFKKLNPEAKMPTRGSTYAAGSDLYACTGRGSVTIAPHTTAAVGTGLAIELPEGCFGAVFARSGLASKQGLRPANCVGVCDSDYRGEYIVMLYNDSDTPRTVLDGDRIAQLVVMPYIPAEFEEADELSDTARGEGGFGSTGR